MPINQILPTPVMLKTKPPGYFPIPNPGRGISVTSGAADAYGTYTQMIAATAAALYIVGIHIDAGGVRYCNVDIGVGVALSEVSQGIYTINSPTATIAAFTTMLPYPIPIANGARIAIRTATENSATGGDYILICIAQSDLVMIP